MVDRLLLLTLKETLKRSAAPDIVDMAVDYKFCEGKYDNVKYDNIKFCLIIINSWLFTIILS